MATPFFGKRENEIPTTGVRPATGSSYAGSGAAPAGTLHSASPASGAQNMTRPMGSELAVPAVDERESGSKLTVGPNIKLKGVEITDCDTLVVEGTVEATMNSRVIQIAEQGAFKGSAEIEIAEIRGEFNGNLIVRQKLVIYATGKVTGTIRYGKLVVEEGGQLSGEIVFGTQGGSLKSAVVVKPGLQAA
ncbi:bactofilin family protein [Polaromonas glacialis]|uniref:bactofilin family protein n=1 Tax=Polaromonas glacialis TaxID=866564 RepID=UPI000496B7A2|nr:polymer-forming cytoskeletal protein [Polaromonas glacialis]